MHDPEKDSDSHLRNVPQDIDHPLEYLDDSTEKDNPISSVDKDLNDENKKASQSQLGNITNTPSSSSLTIEAIPQPDNETIPAHRIKSRSSSVRQEAVLVPRAKRRGLLARFALIPEVERPYDYKRGTKWFITFQVAIAAAAAPIGSAILLRELEHFLVLFI